MLSIFKEKISLFYKTIKFSNNEKKIIKKYSNHKFNQKNENIIFEMVPDYYYLYYYKTLFDQNYFKNYNKIGLWTYFLPTQKNSSSLIFLLRRIYQITYYFFLRKKWAKLYKTIGMVDDVNLTRSDFYLFNTKSHQDKIQFKNREVIFNLKKKNLRVGDLIYDTYLRFRSKPTVFVRDKFFGYLYRKTDQIIANLDDIYKKYKPITYFTGYSSYLQHGLPVRYFIQKDIKVYSGKNNYQLNKKLSKLDYTHTENYKNFKILYAKKKNKKKILEFSKKKIFERFNGKITEHINYLKIDPYKRNKKLENKYRKNIKNIKGVIFLQDFFDAPHDWGKIIFPDFYIWIVYTLSIINKNNLPIALKPHPNTYFFSKETKYLIDRLRKRFKNINWLDPSLSNDFIFKNIDFGVSCSGSILFELAINKKIAISCGDHPGKYFNFTINAKNKIHYRKLLLEYKKLKKKVNLRDLYAFNYMYYYNKNNALDLKNIKLEECLRKMRIATSNEINIFYD